MGYDAKYGHVTTEYGSIPMDEPVIIFRAQDRLAPLMITVYSVFCGMVGSPARHIELANRAQRRFEDWQENNWEKVRVPASEGSRGWLPF
jgi:hypothetical protein